MVEMVVWISRVTEQWPCMFEMHIKQRQCTVMGRIEQRQAAEEENHTWSMYGLSRSRWFYNELILFDPRWFHLAHLHTLCTCIARGICSRNAGKHIRWQVGIVCSGQKQKHTHTHTHTHNWKISKIRLQYEATSLWTCLREAENSQRDSLTKVPKLSCCMVRVGDSYRHLGYKHGAWALTQCIAMCM